VEQRKRSNQRQQQVGSDNAGHKHLDLLQNFCLARAKNPDQLAE
jgi:hypothetical protein